MDKNYIKVKKGTVIFSEGEESNAMYIVADDPDSKVGIYSNYGAPEQTQLTTIAANQMLGEMGVLCGEPRSATAVALSDLTLEKIEKKDINEYLKQHSYMTLELLKSTSETLRRLTKQYTDACVKLNECMQAKESGN